jgi:hypothetical protein
LDQAAQIEKEEIKKLATELWESGVIEDISTLLESLPRDLLLVLRTKYVANVGGREREERREKLTIQQVI